MRFDIVTIFPELVRGAMEEGLLKRSRDREIVKIQVHDLRDWSDDKHRKVDDQPFGGGGGMVLRAEPLFSAVEALKKEDADSATAVVLLCPQGRRLDQAEVRRLAGTFERLILLCGRYEGVDERVREHLVDLELSVGDYVLSGGELPALTVVEAVTRLLPGALGCSTSAQQDSFEGGLLDFPHYTRPSEFRGWKVPEVLLSGDHAGVDRWRHEQSLRRTRLRRPDLYEKNQTLPGTAGLSAPTGAERKR